MESFLQTTSFGRAMEDKSASLSLSGKYESLGSATHTSAFLMAPMPSFPVQFPAPELVGAWKTSSQLLILAFKTLRTLWEALLPLSCVSVLTIIGYICLLCVSGQRLPAAGCTALTQFLPLMTPLPHFLTCPELLTPLSYLRQGQLCVSSLRMFSDSFTRGSPPLVRMSSMKWRDSGFLLHLLGLVLLPAS